MSVLLIQPSYALNEMQKIALSGILQPSLGLGYLEAVLKQNNINVITIDLNVDPQDLIEQTIKENNISIIGLTCYTNNYSNFSRVLQLCKKLAPHAITVAGGIHATFDYKKIIKQVNYIIRFEGEYPFAQLCKKILAGDNDLSSINNLVYTRDSEIYRNKTAEPLSDLDNLPFPILHMHKYKVRTVPISASRGCAFKCIYCSTAAYWGATMRYRSIESVLSEIYHYKKMGYTDFGFTDDNINLDKARFLTLCEKLRDARVTWNASCSLANLNTEIMDMMKDAGCTGISLGIESADREVQKRIGKVIDITRAEELIKYGAAIGLVITCGFILYHYCDTSESIKLTKDFAARIKSIGALPRFAINTPFKGTYQYDHREELGITIKEENTDSFDLMNSVIDTKNFSRDQMTSSLDMNETNINQENFIEILKRHKVTSPDDLTPEIMQKIIHDPELFKNLKL